MLERGVLFETAEGPLMFRGTIAVCCADNLGSHALGGFKELLFPGIGGCSTESICSFCSFKKQLLLVLLPSLAPCLTISIILVPTSCSIYVLNFNCIHSVLVHLYDSGQ